MADKQIEYIHHLAQKALDDEQYRVYFIKRILCKCKKKN